MTDVYQSTIKIKNPHASSGLTLDLELASNTDDEQVHANIKHNSALDLLWLTEQQPHDIRAVIVGGGPSAADHVDDIRELQKDGAYVIALNGAARWLKSHDICVNMQMVMDAQPTSADFIEPSCFCHLLCSQCDPKTIEAVKEPILFHVGSNGVEDHLPPEKVKAGGYALLGGGVCVGNSAVCAAYCLGFRTAHLFGMDCSDRAEETHAYDQPENAKIPTCIVEHAGKTYKSSIAMKVAADLFMQLARELEQSGMSLVMHGDGLLQAKYATWLKVKAERQEAKSLAEAEAAKYKSMWEVPGYCHFSPGEALKKDILDRLAMPIGSKVYDFGCGTARLTKQLSDLGFKATGIDFAPNCLGEDIPFIEACLWDLPAELYADYGICCDVMEHIPSEKVADVIAAIARASGKTYFNIATVPDNFGTHIGETLHLTVESPEWWHNELHKHFWSVECVGVNETSVQLVCTNNGGQHG